MWMDIHSNSIKCQAAVCKENLKYRAVKENVANVDRKAVALALVHC